MDRRKLFRVARGVIGNAVVWGAGWSAAILAVSGFMVLVGNPTSWHETWQLAARLGVVGGLAGGAFSTFVGLVYRGRSLAEIRWVRFGIGGGVVAGIFVPTLMLVGRTISGNGPLAFGRYFSSGLVAAAFGTVAAAISIKLAQRVTRQSVFKSYDEPGLLNARDSLTSNSARNLERSTVQPTSRSDK